MQAASSQSATSTQIYSSNQNGFRQSRNRRPRTADLTIQVHKDENRDLFQQRPSRNSFSSQPQSPTYSQRKKEEIPTLSLGSSSKRMSMPFHFSDYTRETSVTSTNLRFHIHTSPNPTTPITTTSPISRSENQRGDLSFRRPLLGGRSKGSGERRPRTSNGLEGGFCDRITSDLSSFSFFDEPSRAEGRDRHRSGMQRSSSNQGVRRDQDQRFSYLFSPQDEKSQTTKTSTSKTSHRNSIMNFLRKMSPSPSPRKSEFEESQLLIPRSPTSSVPLKSERISRRGDEGFINQPESNSTLRRPSPSRVNRVQQLHPNEIPTSSTSTLPALTAENLALSQLKHSSSSSTSQQPQRQPDEPDILSTLKQPGDPNQNIRRLRSQSVGTHHTLASSNTFPLATPPSPSNSNSPLASSPKPNQRAISPVIEGNGAVGDEERSISPTTTMSGKSGRAGKNSRPKTRRGFD